MAAQPACILISPRPVQEAFKLLPSPSQGLRRHPLFETTLSSLCQQDPILRPVCPDCLPILTHQPAPQPDCWQRSPGSACTSSFQHSLLACEMGRWPLPPGKGQPTQVVMGLLLLQGSDIIGVYPGSYHRGPVRKAKAWVLGYVLGLGGLK